MVPLVSGTAVASVVIVEEVEGACAEVDEDEVEELGPWEEEGWDSSWSQVQVHPAAVGVEVEEP